MSYGILGFIVLILDIIAIVGILGSGKSTGEKLIWIIVVLALPVIGMILWFVMGRKGSI